MSSEMKEIWHLKEFHTVAIIIEMTRFVCIAFLKDSKKKEKKENNNWDNRIIKISLELIIQFPKL